MARPRLLDKQRNKIVKIRMNEKEYQKLNDISQKMELSKSEVIRKAINVLGYAMESYS